VDQATGKPTVRGALKTQCGAPAIVSGPASRFALVCDGGARLFNVDTSGALTPYDEIPGLGRGWQQFWLGTTRSVAFDPSGRFIYSLGTSVTNPGPVGVRTHEILADGRLREVAFAALLDSIKPGAIVVAPLDAE
jgi:hypothetical protein